MSVSTFISLRKARLEQNHQTVCDYVFFNALLLLWRKNQEFFAIFGSTGLQNHHPNTFCHRNFLKKKWCSSLIIISSSNNHPPKILTLAAAPCAVVSPATSSGEAPVSTTSASRKSDHFGGGSRLKTCCDVVLKLGNFRSGCDTSTVIPYTSEVKHSRWICEIWVGWSWRLKTNCCRLTWNIYTYELT